MLVLNKSQKEEFEKTKVYFRDFFYENAIDLVLVSKDDEEWFLPDRALNDERFVEFFKVFKNYTIVKNL